MGQGGERVARGRHPGPLFRRLRRGYRPRQGEGGQWFLQRTACAGVVKRQHWREVEGCEDAERALGGLQQACQVCELGVQSMRLFGSVPVYVDMYFCMPLRCKLSHMYYSVSCYN